MQIQECVFPDTLYYDIENFIWFDIDFDTKTAIVGLTPILLSISGKLIKIKLKEVGSLITRGKSIGTIESNRYFNSIRIPFSGRIVSINNILTKNPKTVNNSPYDHGWLAKIYVDNIDDVKNFKKSSECSNELKDIISEYHVRCFKEFPDHELFEIGTECAATLVKLDELLSKIDLNDVVYLVSDDITADLELTRWAQENNQQIVEIRKGTSNLFHILVKKTS